MKYSCRPGIVLSKICGVWLLIPTREASEHCPGILHLTLPSVFVWGMLEKGKSERDMCKALSILMHKDEDAMQDVLHSIIQSFLKKGALIASDRGNA